ncbi:cysteine dioxygenase family protein [Nocardioides sp. cx-173]|uniref:cysteine dioxygenase family protein n=1 Tax=Nocardioides sp. cx-173 TaxID=2898796 RepID=UPI001E338375|nr:cysteine dioxygenase family protein [Nocardioides sp. cx-173]MCD4526865.1 cysteine dioxygenase family protein [Nocardioides sp. cx-173]UGB41346.1 cysteine dioxygenase family protein [Nocardioides sp. cx-173]
MTTAVQDPRLAELIEEVGELVATHHDEHELTRLVAERLRAALAAGIDLPPSVTKPGEEHYVMYPLHVDPAGRFSLASAVWNVGQGTPVHGHETWGVVGIHSGVEREVSFAKPAHDGDVPRREAEVDWTAGQVTVCCTTDDDVHQVFCGGDEPCVGIHVYGADIGTLPRRSYQPDTGEVSWFTSTWTPPAS